MGLKLRVGDAMAIIGLVGFVAYLTIQRRESTQPAVPADRRLAAFRDQLDLTPLRQMAVQADGRLRSFESHANAYVRRITGPSDLYGAGYGFAYLDMLFRPQAYDSQDCIYIKNSLILSQMLERLGPGALPPEREAAIRKSKLIAPAILAQPVVRGLLAELGRDLIRTAKFTDLIQGALFFVRPGRLGSELRLVPPAGGDVKQPWLSLWVIGVAGESGASEAGALVGVDSEEADAARDAWRKLPEKDREAVRTAWAALASSWRNLDAGGANQALIALGDGIKRLSPPDYPAASRLGWESWYARQGSMTWIWLIYLIGVIPLLVSVIQPWSGARRVGLGLFIVAFAMHTASLGLRWYISGRWPNANMFEAVTTAAWFGGVLALVMEIGLRGTPMRSLFALASSVVSMVSLMAAYYLPATLDSSINNVTPALHDIWLYIHTNVIIWSYAIIGLAAVTALLYLRTRWCRLWDSGEVAKWRLAALPPAFLAAHIGGWEILLSIVNPERYVISSMLERLAIYSAFAAGGAFLLFEALEARERARFALAGKSGGSGMDSRPRLGVTHAAPFILPEVPSAAAVFDSATMVSLQLAFVMLWSGIVMGAIWADHSWGRPWGWDPKEVFALNTFIIFLVLIHVRLKVRDKGLWTAVLAVLGFETMLFNWIVINFIISGLHSYA